MHFLNMKPTERIVRVLLGLTMLSLGWFGEVGPWAVPLRMLGLYPSITGFAGWCPVVALLVLLHHRRRK